MMLSLNRITEILLISFLVLFPLSYVMLTNRLMIFFIIMLLLLIVIFVIKKKKPIPFQLTNIIYTFIVLAIFDCIDQVNFFQLYNIHLDLNKWIPISTVILSIVLILYTSKLLIDEKINISYQNFLFHFVITALFLFILIFIFYPFIQYFYHIGFYLNIQ